MSENVYLNTYVMCVCVCILYRYVHKVVLYADLHYFQEASFLLHTIHCCPPTVTMYTSTISLQLLRYNGREKASNNRPILCNKEYSENINNLEDILLLPTQATTYERDGLDQLVCPSLPRAGEARTWLHQAQMMCGRVHTIILNYEEGSEVACVGVDMPHQTSDTTERNSEVGINFGVLDAHGHTTLHYIPQLVPQPETTTLHTPVAFTSDFTYEHQIEDGESIPNSWLRIVATESLPATQEFVSGRIT